MESFAAAGHSGKNPGNLQRALVAAIGQPAGFPEIAWAEIPVKGSTSPKPHPFLFPHQMLASIHTQQPELFEMAFGERDGIREF